MFNFGFWQLRRLDERQTFNATVVERTQHEPLDLAALLDESTFTPSTSEWSIVTATGSYLPDQLLLFNRSQNGVAGDNVLTALALDDGRTVIVNRGFVKLDTPPPTPPGTKIEIVGRIRQTQVRTKGGVTDSNDGVLTEVRRVDIAKIAPQLPGDVVPVYIDLISSSPAVSPTDPAPLPLPDLGEGNHLSYAFQWFIFAVCVAIGWVLAVRRSLATRRTEQPA
jgi:cytochrome oxidase assembly protein ShyY1